MKEIATKSRAWMNKFLSWFIQNLTLHLSQQDIIAAIISSISYKPNIHCYSFANQEKEKNKNATHKPLNFNCQT